jgi:ribosomal protein L23
LRFWKKKYNYAQRHQNILAWELEHGTKHPSILKVLAKIYKCSIEEVRVAKSTPDIIRFIRQSMHNWQGQASDYKILLNKFECKQ